MRVNMENRNRMWASWEWAYLVIKYYLGFVTLLKSGTLTSSIQVPFNMAFLFDFILTFMEPYIWFWVLNGKNKQTN